MAAVPGRRNVLTGTPDYVAPEQVQDAAKADNRSDLYSLGCTFFHLLSGRVPFPGGRALEKLVRHATETPPALERLRPDVPPTVAAIVRRLMAKRPEDRFATAAELAAALAPFCSGATSSAPVGPPSSPFLDTLATPAGGSAFGISAEADDGSALAGTLGLELAATSMGSSRQPLSSPGESQPNRRRRLAPGRPAGRGNRCRPAGRRARSVGSSPHVDSFLDFFACLASLREIFLVRISRKDARHAKKSRKAGSTWIAIVPAVSPCPPAFRCPTSSAFPSQGGRSLAELRAASPALLHCRPAAVGR